MKKNQRSSLVPGKTNLGMASKLGMDVKDPIIYRVRNWKNGITNWFN